MGASLLGGILLFNKECMRASYGLPWGALGACRGLPGDFLQNSYVRYFLNLILDFEIRFGAVQVIFQEKIQFDKFYII